MRAEVRLRAGAGWLRHRVRLVLIAALAGVASVATAAEATAPAAIASATQLLQQRFLATAQGWRKAVLKLPGVKPHEAELVGALRIVVAPTPLPMLRGQTRLEGHVIVVTAGWLTLLDDLLRAEALSELDARGKACLTSYQAAIEAARKKERETPTKPPQVWLRLASFVEADKAAAGCGKFRLADLRSPAVQARVEYDADTVVLWLLTRQAARLVALPVPLPAAVQSPSGASAPGSEKKPEVTCAPPAVGARSVSSSHASTDERTDLALACYGRTPPQSLDWLRAHAAELFDKETAALLKN